MTEEHRNPVDLSTKVGTRTVGDTLARTMEAGVGQQIPRRDRPLLRAAFARFGARPPSYDAAECAAALLRLMRS